MKYFFTKIVLCALLALHSNQSIVGMIPGTTHEAACKRLPKLSPGDTLLNYFARNGDIEEVIRLINEGVDIDSIDHRNDTPLCAAAGRGHEAIVAYLVSQGADIDASGYFKMTPLSMAVFNKYVGIVKFLAEHGARVDLRNANGDMPLHWAIRHERQDMIEILLKYGADTTVRGFWYVPSLLRYTREYGFIPALKLLVKHSADLYSTIREWGAVHEVALSMGHTEVVALLDRLEEEQRLQQVTQS